MTSSKVTKSFLPIALHRKELRYRAWSHCVQFSKTHRMVCIFALEDTRSRDLRSTDDLDLMRSWYTYFDAYQREDLDGALRFALGQLVQKVLAKKNPSFPCTAILTFYPVTSFLI